DRYLKCTAAKLMAEDFRGGIVNYPKKQIRGSRRRGFSLIELVIVVVIIAIIGAIAIPKMSRGAAGAAESATIQNLAVMRSAIDLYNSEHPGATLGSSTSATQLLQALTYY